MGTCPQRSGRRFPSGWKRQSAVFDSDSAKRWLVVVAPELVKGPMALVIVEPKDGVLDVHLLLNAYDKDGGPLPLSAWARNGLMLHADKKKWPRRSVKVEGSNSPSTVTFRQGTV